MCIWVIIITIQFFLIFQNCVDDEWLTDWYGYNQPLAAVVRTQSPEKASFEEELQEFYKLAQIKKLNQNKSSQESWHKFLILFHLIVLE